MHIDAPAHTHAHILPGGVGYVQHTNPDCEEYLEEQASKKELSLVDDISIDIETFPSVETVIKELWCERDAVRKAAKILDDANVKWLSERAWEYEHELTEDLRWYIAGYRADIETSRRVAPETGEGT